MVLSIGSLLVLHFESRAPGANIDSGPDAIWWAIVTIATVGYGDLYPVSAAGRITAIVLMLVGIGIFGVLASYLSSTFLPSDRARARDVKQIVDRISDLRDDVADLRSELKAVRELLRARDGEENPGE
jgi:voltage-gated potassium channel